MVLQVMDEHDVKLERISSMIDGYFQNMTVVLDTLERELNDEISPRYTELFNIIVGA